MSILPAEAGLATALALYGAGFVIVGEALRRPLAGWALLLAGRSSLERGLLDLYLGGGVLLAAAYLPFGAFYPGTFPVLVLAGTVILAIELRVSAGTPLCDRTVRWGRELLRPGPSIAGALAAGLYLGELALAVPAPSGNTFDGSLLTFYVARLLELHHLPMSFLPSAPVPIAYPPGTTVYLGAAQSLLGLAPDRGAPLLTPLFLGIAPLAGYILGERLVGRSSAGVAFAAVLALASAYPRLVLSGHYDFLFALPLDLLLLSWMWELWSAPKGPAWPDALAFGGIAGLAATLNPAGSAWVFIAAVPLVAVAGPAHGPTRRWAVRWLGAVAAGLVVVLPQLLATLAPRGAADALAVTGPGGPAPGGLPGVLLGLLNPFQLGTGNLALSPFPAVEVELSGLLVAGIALLAWPRARRLPGPGGERFAHVALAGVVAGVAIVVATLAGEISGSIPLELVGSLTSTYETSLLVLTLLTLVAAWPLFLLLDRAATEDDPVRNAPDGAAAGRARGRPPRARAAPTDGALLWGTVVLLLLPGLATTVIALPGYAATSYRAFGNLSAGDTAMLEWAGEHLPPGARVLVAPGGAGEFLIGYAPSVVLLYPMFGKAFENASFALLDRELQNGTLDGAGVGALAVLRADFVVVTEANNVLFPHAWRADPFLSPSAPATGFGLAFHEQDAYVFARAAAGG